MRQRIQMLRAHDCADIAVRPHPHPIPGRHSVRIAEVTIFINDVATWAEDVDAKAGARGYGFSPDLVTEQRPVRTLEKLEQARRLAPSSPKWRIGCTISGEQAAQAFRFYQPSGLNLTLGVLV
jgi:hypothetical protein